MAERRMFAKTIINSDAFLDMPLTTQALYFHLGMVADDDGFVNSPKRVQRTIGASDDDLKLLIAKRFIIPFSSGIVVIKHWKINNFIRTDRYKQTVYQEEKALLDVKENDAYTFGIPSGNQTVDSRYTQYSIGKDSIGKYSIDNNMITETPFDDEIEALNDAVDAPNDEVDITTDIIETPTNRSKKNNYEDEFEEVWSYYPKKQGKQAAYKSYVKARKDGVTKEIILDGLKRYVEYIRSERTEPRYIKQGSTWFNQRCWEDDYTVTRKLTTKDIASKYDFSDFM